LRHLARLAVVLCSVLIAGTSAADGDSDCVILLHGMARTTSSMEDMQEFLTGEGYRVVNDGYPSRDHPIEILAPMAIAPAIEKCNTPGSTGQVHFVTHSLGGILVRYYFKDNVLENLGRTVMLGPPNQGSAASDAMRNIWGFDLINGPAGSQLGKGEDSIPLQLGSPDFEFAVIAGNKTIDPITSAMLENPDDGKVSVQDTKLKGMSDFALVAVSHAYIMQDERVFRLVKSFLEEGRFPDYD
jgi:triacylglycerol lipase